jgi:hypothetical protein
MAVHGERGIRKAILPRRICDGKLRRRPAYDRPDILRQPVTGNAALGRLANRIDGIGATGRAMGNFCQIGFQIFHRGHIRGLFAFFQRPLLLGGVNLPKVVNAGVFL